MLLSKKVILIISPNHWGTMLVSKHHYAKELAKKGTIVYFLNPPDLKSKLFEKIEIEKNLHVINYKPIFRGKKILPLFIFNFLILIQVKFLQIKIKDTIDIIWSFTTDFFSSLRYFKSNIKIYHPVDHIVDKQEVNYANKADFIFSVAQEILNPYKKLGKPIYLINHGLSEIFAEKSKLIKPQSKKMYEHINVCYLGSLLIKFLDRDILRRIILDNPNVVFTFIGPISIEDSNLSGWKNNETFEFINFLKNQINVRLEGVKSQEYIANTMQSFDAFLICYKYDTLNYKCSNSHKILEYMSTGKVIISSYISYYHNSDLIEMINDLNNENLIDHFKKIINNLEYYNSVNLQRKRINYALANTYANQIDRIENIINNSLEIN